MPSGFHHAWQAMLWPGKGKKAGWWGIKASILAATKEKENRWIAEGEEPIRTIAYFCLHPDKVADSTHFHWKKLSWIYVIDAFEQLCHVAVCSACAAAPCFTYLGGWRLKSSNSSSLQRICIKKGSSLPSSFLCLLKQLLPRVIQHFINHTSQESINSNPVTRL